METRTKRFRVLFYNHTSEVSGAEVLLLSIATSLMANVDVVIAAPEGELLSRARQNGIRVEAIASASPRMSRNFLVIAKGSVQIWKASRNLKRIIIIVKPDILHANSIRAGLIASLIFNSKVAKVWHVHDFLERNLIGIAIRYIAKYTADKLIAISQAVAIDIGTEPPMHHKVDVIHNGIDTNAQLGTSIRCEFSVSEQCFVVGVVGQVAPWKGQDIAITAFAMFVKDYPNAELWIVGEPKFRERNRIYDLNLRRLVSELGLNDKIRFLGARRDVNNVMASIDVLLVPSQKEPFGLVIIEAMLAGKPVIGTAAGGVPEIIVDGETGWLVQSDDVSEFYGKLRKVYQDLQTEQGIARYKVMCRERVLQRFSLYSTIKKLVSCYDEILEG